MYKVVGEWVAGSGGRWEAEGRLWLQLGHRQLCCVFNKGQNKHNPQDRRQWLLAVVWYHSHPYSCHPEASQAL